MDAPADRPTYSAILENIFGASTLEDAIRWRETMLARLQEAINAAAKPGGFSPGDVSLHQDARFQMEIAIVHLRLCLLNEERVFWVSEKGRFEASNVWTNSSKERDRT